MHDLSNYQNFAICFKDDSAKFILKKNSYIKSVAVSFTGCRYLRNILNYYKKRIGQQGT
jgi:hypothetical protein